MSALAYVLEYQLNRGGRWRLTGVSELGGVEHLPSLITVAERYLATNRSQWANFAVRIRESATDRIVYLVRP